MIVFAAVSTFIVGTVFLIYKEKDKLVESGVQLLK